MVDKDDSANNSVLYVDKYIQISQDTVVLFNYHFFGYSKTFKVSDIEKVNCKELTMFTGKFRIYGINYKLNYFPFDLKRYKKSKGIELNIKLKILKPIITPDNPDKIYDLLQSLVEKNTKI